MQLSPENTRISDASGYRLWLIIFGVALLMRALNIAALTIEPEALLQNDSSLYWSGAAVMLDEGSFSKNGSSGPEPQTERVPGYFMLLVAVQALFGESLLAALIVQALLDSLTCVLIAVLAAQLSPQLILPAGILAALWPNLIIHSGTILSDSLFVFLFTAMLVASGRFLSEANARWAGLAGLALGLAILTRPVAQLLPALMLPIAFLLPLLHRRGIAYALAVSLLFLACSVVPLAPLVYRNYTDFGTMSLTSQSGTHLTGWVAPLVRRADDGTPREKGAFDLNAEAQALLVARGKRLDELTPFEQSRLLSEVGVTALGRYSPFAFIKAWTNGAIINLAAPAVAIDNRVRALPHPSFDKTAGDGLYHQVFNFLSNSSKLYLTIMGGGIILSLLFIGLQIFGFVALVRMAPWPAFFAILTIGYFLAINGPVGSPKYRLPFEPILIVLSGLALVRIAGWLRRH